MYAHCKIYLGNKKVIGFKDLCKQTKYDLVKV